MPSIRCWIFMRPGRNFTQRNVFLTNWISCLTTVFLPTAKSIQPTASVSPLTNTCFFWTKSRRFFSLLSKKNSPSATILPLLKNTFCEFQIRRKNSGNTEIYKGKEKIPCFRSNPENGSDGKVNQSPQPEEFILNLKSFSISLYLGNELLYRALNHVGKTVGSSGNLPCFSQ